MATKEQVEEFLKRLKEKIKVFGIIFRDDRGKNLQTLADLEITAVYRRKVILNIEPEDYSEGPIVDTLNKVGEMWVFGKDVKGREVYIKITLGHPNNSTICISFHIAEHPMSYPFKG
ncbi:MAG: toxin [Prevotella sp.]|nr:toxin [Prevotella sp.]